MFIKLFENFLESRDICLREFWILTDTFKEYREDLPMCG